MAQTSGQANTYQGNSYPVSWLVPQKMVIADMIDMIDPRDVPLLRYLGIGPKGKGGSKAEKFRLQNWPSTRYVWLEDNLATLSDTLGSAALSTDTSLTMSNSDIFRNGDVIQADGSDELMLVTAVSGTTVTVTRGFAGTTAAAISSGTQIDIISRARVEGADSEDDYKTNVDTVYNYTQIFQAEVRVSRTQDKIAQFGKNGEFDYQVQKKFTELTRLLERTLFYGRRNAGTASTPRSMGGLREFITTNVTNLSSAPLTQKDLEDKIQTCWESGGMPNLIVCNGWVKRKISSFYASSVRTQRTEKVGGVTIEKIDTEFGELGILLDRWCPTDELHILSTDYIGIVPLDEFFYQDLAVVGDYKRGQIVGEYGFVVKNDKAHARLTGISTTS